MIYILSGGASEVWGMVPISMTQEFLAGLFTISMQVM